MPRSLLVATVFLAAGFSLPAFAGEASYADGQGAWSPKACGAPVAPAGWDGDPEALAEDVNARIARHNAFVEEVGVYMDCVRKEAERDAETMGRIITDAAQKLINTAQEAAEASALRARSHK